MFGMGGEKNTRGRKYYLLRDGRFELAEAKIYT
jgi:hypothetical protein